MTNFTLLDREQFTQYHAAFKKLAAARQLTPADMMLHNIIRGLPLDRGFSATTNQRKLSSGQHPMLGLKQASTQLRYLAKYRKQELNARFAGMLTDQALDQIAAQGEYRG